MLAAAGVGGDAVAMLSIDVIKGLAVALGIGLLIGVERERRKGAGRLRGAAGVRTFSLVALSGAVAALLGPVGIAVAGAFTALAALSGYRASRARDPGLTTEFAMLVAFLLGVLALREPVLAAGLGVAVAVLLATRNRLHAFVRHALTAQELHDALLLAAAAAIVLPLLPDRAIDPWRVLNPRQLWLLAVIVMAISAGGYIALRLFGARVGLLLAGLAGGFASSTATIAGMGALARRHPQLARSAAGAGLVSSVSTVVQMAVISAMLAPALLRVLAWPLLAAGAAIVAFAGVSAWRSRGQPLPDPARIRGRAFQPLHALAFAAAVALVLVASAAALDWLGDAALQATLAISGLADVHAATASAARLVAVRRITPEFAVPAVGLAFAANAAMKWLMARLNGSAEYAWRLLPGLVATVAAYALAAWALR